MITLRTALAVFLLACGLALLARADDWQATGKQGAVVAGSSEAVEAGLEMLKADGNAVDAAVASLLMLSVTDSGNFCFGGEVPILVYNAERKSVEVVAGQGAAPRLATLEHFQKQGGISGKGAAAAAVPAALDAMLVALERHGTVTFEQVSAPTLRVLASQPDPWCQDLARTIEQLVAAEKQAPEDRRRGLRLAADCFYRGPIARRIDTWSQANGGLLRYVDLATHVTRVEEPATVDYRGYTVVKCGVWTQGPCLLQSLRLLEGLSPELKSLGHNSADYVHVTTEALKLALADRDTYYADPLFQDVPLAALLSRKYADLRRPLLDLRRASLESRPGDPLGNRPLKEGSAPAEKPSGRQQDTTTCLTADRWGNVVAATPSGWGGVVAGDTGVTLGSRLQSLNTQAGHPNCIEPGKRPRITLTPTLVLKNGQALLAISVAGGDLQDQVSLQLLLNCLDFSMSPAEAVTAARFSTSHHVGSFGQTPPKLGNLTLDEELADRIAADLQARGHQVQRVKPPQGHPCVLSLDPATGSKHAAGDPKANRRAGAY